MKNIFLCIAVIGVLIAGSVGGTLAGFVDTEESKDNFIQAGISDLLINGLNDPEVPAKISFDHASPGKSIDFWADAYNWGKCQGGNLALHFKDVVSVEAGAKNHLGIDYIYDGVADLGGGIPKGYRPPVGNEPIGPNVWSSEPEKIAEVGDGFVGNEYISATDPDLMGEDYASGVSENLTITVTIPLKGATGNELGNPDTNGDGVVDGAEYTAWVTNGNRWVTVNRLTGVLAEIACTNVDLGFLRTQEKTFIHIDAKLLQPAATMRDYDHDGVVGDSDDVLLNYWPTNALQGDKATWTMLFTLFTDDPPTP